MLKKIVGGGYLTNSSPFVITLYLTDEEELISSSVSFDEAKEIVKTTPIRFAITMQRINETITANIWDWLPFDMVQNKNFVNELIIPSYCSNPYKICSEFRPSYIGECFFIRTYNSAKTTFFIWTRDGIKRISSAE